ncbi:hypothetical protein GMRT_12073 [Giardia muris]|uniref:Uncharacterized protein n=1 Tax=Giardia muris TaxID=5742 RepID=A0A4Z1SRS1_GIAMU|nr:hypothetical protein GMRT_12073 [Giardia muris]|eukprot:TNJ27685.1 hypothetical protein GMRT_12073 [Giardia muris]
MPPQNLFASQEEFYSHPVLNQEGLINFVRSPEQDLRDYIEGHTEAVQSLIGTLAESIQDGIQTYQNVDFRSGIYSLMTPAPGRTFFVINEACKPDSGIQSLPRLYQVDLSGSMGIHNIPLSIKGHVTYAHHFRYQDAILLFSTYERHLWIISSATGDSFLELNNILAVKPFISGHQTDFFLALVLQHSSIRLIVGDVGNNETYTCPTPLLRLTDLAAELGGTPSDGRNASFIWNDSMLLSAHLTPCKPHQLSNSYESTVWYLGVCVAIPTGIHLVHRVIFPLVLERISSERANDRILSLISTMFSIDSYQVAPIKSISLSGPLTAIGLSSSTNSDSSPSFLLHVVTDYVSVYGLDGGERLFEDILTLTPTLFFEYPDYHITVSDFTTLNGRTILSGVRASEPPALLHIHFCPEEATFKTEVCPIPRLAQIIGADEHHGLCLAGDVSQKTVTLWRAYSTNADTNDDTPADETEKVVLSRSVINNLKISGLEQHILDESIIQIKAAKEHSQQAPTPSIKELLDKASIECENLTMETVSASTDALKALQRRVFEVFASKHDDLDLRKILQSTCGLISQVLANNERIAQACTDVRNKACLLLQRNDFVRRSATIEQSTGSRALAPHPLSGSASFAAGTPFHKTLTNTNW